MPSIKDSLKKIVSAANKTATVSKEGLERMRIVAEKARNESKNPLKK